MRILALVLSVLVTTQVFAAQVELGKYRAKDKASQTIVADLTLRANSTLDFALTSPDIAITGCQGSYKVDGDTFTADVKCPSNLFPQAKVTIDIKNVTPQSIRSPEGAEVNVVLEDNDPETFLLKKND